MLVHRIAYGITAALTIVAITAQLLHAPVLLLFVLTSLALIGLAWLLGQAIESVGYHAGPRISGVLNATFGNAAELIITIFALSAGLTGVVKASIIGSVIGNVLLVLGASILLGGLKNGTQSFSTTIAGANAAMLAIVTAGLALPTVFATVDPAEGTRAWSTEYLSIGVAVVLLVLYALYLLFYLRRQEQPGGEEQQPEFGKVVSLGLLGGTTAAVAYVSEVFVETIEPLVEELGISELFIGVILVPIVGNVAEHVVGVQLAYKDKMDFSMAISLGSSLQVALLVTPILVFLGPLLGHPLDLVFTPLELASLGAAVV
ncbi:MAG: calcium/proton exchanger, partial [Rubrobacter sp.]|nr:calcium/proton exchanger [Rubrobacter sp.]